MARTRSTSTTSPRAARTMKDLLGGKGANLAEMTNLGLPVPPGFTITTEACQAYLSSGPRAGRARRRGQRAPRRARAGDGQEARPVRRPAAGLGAVRGEVLDARDDGDRPQRRPQRPVGARAGRAGRQRAVRVRLLPPADPDVRQDRAGHRRRALRGRARRGQGRPRAPTNDLDLDADDLRKLVETFKEVVVEQAGRRVPAGAARADGPGRPGRLRLVEHRAGGHLPAPGAHPGRPRHRGQHLLDGVRQPRHGLRHRRGVHPRPGVSGAQGIYGDYLQNAQGEDVVAGIRNTVPLADLETDRQEVLRRAAARSCRPSRSTTATCATSSSPSSAASCGCCRPGSASAPPAAAFRIATQLVDQGLIDMDEALSRVTGAQLAQLMFPRFDDTAEQQEDRAGHERLARRGGRQGRLRLLHRGEVVALAARRSSWSAARPTPTTSTA